MSKAPRPQKVPPPIELPPIRSNLSSDSTLKKKKHMDAPFRKSQSTNSAFLSVSVCVCMCVCVVCSVHNVTKTCRPSAVWIYLYYWDSRSNIYKQVWEDVRVCILEPEFRISVFGIHKSLMGDILQNKVASLNQTSHFILFVHSKRKYIQLPLQ